MLAAMRRRSLDVGIVGCGTAGSAAAVFLARRGHRVTVYERVPDPRPIGAGIILQPSGQAVLARLGLRDAVVARGAPLDALRVETIGRRTVAHLRYRPGANPPRYGVGLHRGVLFASLFAAVKAGRALLRLGVGVHGLRPARRPDGGQYLVGDDGALHGPHELVIVADGARLQLRDHTDRLLPKRVRPYPWGALWFVGKEAGAALKPELHQVVSGTRRMGGMLPTGTGPDPANAAPLASLFWSFRTAGLEAWRAGSLSAWKDEVSTFFPAARDLLDQIASHDDVLFASYQDVEMPRWHTHDVVYLGDAAHAMSPQLGQGCNLALFDAMVLADCIEENEHLATALACYSSARRGHLIFYQLATRWLTPFFQSELTPLAWVRDTLMTLASKLPFFHRQMVDTMCGVKAGVFSEVPLPEH